MFSYVVTKQLKTMADIAEMARHAARLGETLEGRVRTDADPDRRAIAWRIREPTEDDPATSITEYVREPEDDETIQDVVDIRAAYTAQLKRTGAQVRKSQKLTRVLHLLVGVSPDYVREAGDLHSAQNLNNIALVETVRTWAEATFGEQAPIAWRLDCDERGGAVVDLFLMPTREMTIGRPRKVNGAKVWPEPKLFVAPTAALDELARKYGHKRRRNWAALQDSWAEYAQEHLDERLERGTPQGISGVEHLSPEAYGELQDLEREVAEAKAADKAVQADRAEAEAARDAARSELAELRPALREVRQARTDLPQLRRERQAAEVDRDRARREADEAETARDAARREQQAAEATRDQALRENAEAEAERNRLDHGLDRARAALAEATDRAHRSWAYVSELGSWLGDLLPRAAELVGRPPPQPPEDLFPEPEPGPEPDEAPDTP